MTIKFVGNNFLTSIKILYEVIPAYLIHYRPINMFKITKESIVNLAIKIVKSCKILVVNFFYLERNKQPSTKQISILNHFLSSNLEKSMSLRNKTTSKKSSDLTRNLYSCVP